MPKQFLTIGDFTFLEEGPFTQRDKIVKEKSKELGNGNFFTNVSRYLESLSLRVELFDQQTRKRTASQIIASGYKVDAADEAIVFAALARELVIPTIYVEALNSDWFDTLHNHNAINLHSFVDIFTGGRWRKYHPRYGLMAHDRYSLEGNDYTLVGRGLDFAHLFPKVSLTNQVQSFKALCLQDIIESAAQQHVVTC